MHSFFKTLFVGVVFGASMAFAQGAKPDLKAMRAEIDREFSKPVPHAAHVAP